MEEYKLNKKEIKESLKIAAIYFDTTEENLTDHMKQFGKDIIFYKKLLKKVDEKLKK